MTGEERNHSLPSTPPSKKHGTTHRSKSGVQFSRSALVGVPSQRSSRGRRRGWIQMEVTSHGLINGYARRLRSLEVKIKMSGVTAQGPSENFAYQVDKWRVCGGAFVFPFAHHAVCSALALRRNCLAFLEGPM